MDGGRITRESALEMRSTWDVLAKRGVGKRCFIARSCGSVGRAHDMRAPVLQEDAAPPRYEGFFPAADELPGPGTKRQSVRQTAAALAPALRRKRSQRVPQLAQVNICAMPCGRTCAAPSLRASCAVTVHGSRSNAPHSSHIDSLEVSRLMKPSQKKAQAGLPIGLESRQSKEELRPYAGSSGRVPSA